MRTSNDELVEYLCSCPSEECFLILKGMESVFSPDSNALMQKCLTVESIPAQNSCERQLIARSAVDLLRWYGSDAFAYGFRNMFADHPGVSYSEILRDVALLLNKQLDKQQQIDILPLASVAEIEEMVVRLTLGLSFKDKTEQEIAAILEESGLSRGAATDAAKPFAYRGAAGIALTVLIQLLGKKTVQLILERVIFGIVTRVVGKEAAQALARRLLIQVTQKALLAWLTIITVIWTITDVGMFLSAPAKRITVPTVILVSSFRVRHRLAAN